MSLFTPHKELFTAIFSSLSGSNRASRASRLQRLHSGGDAPARTPTAGHSLGAGAVAVAAATDHQRRRRRRPRVDVELAAFRGVALARHFGLSLSARTCGAGRPRPCPARR